MKEYKIKRINRGEGYETMVICEGNEERAEYRLTPGHENAEIAAMRRSINRHLENPGATLGNYQF